MENKERQVEIAGGLMGALAAMIGGLPAVYLALLGLQALDLIEGIIATVRTGKSVQPLLLWIDVLGKAQTWIVVMCLWLLRLAAPEQVPAEIALMPSAGVAFAFAVHEAFSILKNAARAGQWVPDVLKRMLASEAAYSGPGRREQVEPTTTGPVPLRGQSQERWHGP